MAETKLTDEIRAEIVVRFACWEPMAQVQEWLAAEHPEIEIGHTALSYYNLDNRSSRAKATPQWIKLFDDTRAQVNAETAAVPTANKVRRMAIRDQLITGLMTGKDGKPKPVSSVLAEDVNRLLEHQAREMGGMFTNVRTLKHDAVGALAQLLGCDPSELPQASDADA